MTAKHIAARILEETGGTLVPPFDHPMIMAGQGTAALELLEETAGSRRAGGLCRRRRIAGGHAPRLRSRCSPASGFSAWSRKLANDTALSFAAGERVTIPPPDTIADGLRSPSPGKLTFPVMQRHVEQILLVSEAEIRATVRFLMERVKIVVEPSGAVALAAVLFGMLPREIGSAGVVLSGGNVDLDFLKTL